MKELKYLDYTKGNEGHILIPSCKSVYPDMGVGTAQAIQTNIHESDSTPYVFRKTPYRSTRETDKLVGASMAWNQLVKARDSSTGSPSLSYTKINDYQLLLSGSRDAVTLRLSAASNIQFYEGHKYLAYHNDTTFPATKFVLSNGAGEATNTTGNVGVIINATATATGYYGVYIPNGVSFNNTISVNLIDITLAIGPTIADYIYTLESGTAGAGIAKLRECGFFTSPYYAYNAGGIESVNVSKHKMTGLNQWDEEWEAKGIMATTGENDGTAQRIRSKNQIPVFPSTSYYLQFDTAKYSTGRVACYDATGAYLGQSTGWKSVNSPSTFTTPANCYYVRFVFVQANEQYTGGICLNISNPAVNGQYAPYEVHEYPLADVTLRGILKLDGSNNLYADGDVYESDGTVTRKYGAVDLGSFTWSYDSTNMIFYKSYTDGNAKYKGTGITPKYTVKTSGNNTGLADGELLIGNSQNNPVIYIKDTSFNGDTAAFKTAMNGVYLVYELYTTTTETTDPYTNPQVCSPYGTEEYVDRAVAAGTRDVSIPCGHETEYAKDIVGAIEGIPFPPSSNGTYTLKVTVASGVPTYSWVSG